MPIATELARWSVGLRPDEVPPKVAEAVRTHLLDGVGCALAGLRMRSVAAAVTVATDLGGPPEATIIGNDSQLGAPAAAFANGALVHALDFDDTHPEGLVHATAVVLPAAFAVGEQLGSSGEEILIGALVGYEAICRIAAASPHGFHARGLHATKVAGVFAAALTTSRLLGLDATRTTDALGIAGSSAGGLLEFLATGSSTKQLHPGSAAASGILSARLAAAGASGPASVFEGSNGLYSALSGRPADAARIVAGLGSTWEVTRIAVKPYPCCHLSHASIAALAPLAARGAEPATIDEIVVGVHPDSIPIVCEPAPGKVSPRTSYEAKFSLPWTLAALLLDGSITVDTYSQDSIGRLDVAELAGRVRCVAKPDGASAADALGHVLVRLRDGREINCRTEPPGPAHIAETAARAKLIGNLGGDRQWAEQLAVAVLGLGQRTELSEVLRIASHGAVAPAIAGASR